MLGTVADDVGYGAVVDSKGNIYSTGSTGGFLDGNLNAGNLDLFLVKYNPVGVKQWTRQLGTGADDIGRGVAIDDSNNLYVTGYTGGALDGNPNAGNFDIFLVKYNSSGVKQWTRQLGTVAQDIGRGVAIDDSNNLYVTGYTGGALDGNPNAGNFDIFLAKYDSSGVKQWTRQLGTVADDVGYGVAVDSRGNVYVTGETSGGLDGNTNLGAKDIFLVKYNSSGVKQWTRQLGATADDIGYGVAVDSSDSLYVTGFTTGAELRDIFLVKYDSSGLLLWTQQLGTAADDVGNGANLDSYDNVYVTGYTGGTLDGNPNAGNFDIFLVKYGSTGVKQWTRQLGTISDDVGRGLSINSKNNIYVTGSTGGDLDGKPNAGNFDIFLVKYDSAGVLK